MYGDSEVIRRRVDQLREQGSDIRRMADHLVGQSDQVHWTGRAADAMRERVRDRATQLRECASAHDGAADALEHHAQQVELATDTITQTQRRAAALAEDGRLPVAVELPPPGHRDWLGVELPGH
jgi:hypothetical protein